MYDNLAITQRGVADESTIDRLADQPPVPFFQGDGTTRVARFPTIRCKSRFGASALRAVKKAYEVAGRDWPAAAAKWNEVLSGPREAIIDRMMWDPDAVKIYAELEYAAQSECRKYPEYDLGTNAARGHMVYQDFMGTHDLARDLDHLRAAVGSERLSVWGISYGTEVGATYASAFPERVDKLILDGNVAISNEIRNGADTWALGLEHVWNGLAFGCNADYFLRGGDARESLPADDLCATTPYPTQKILDLVATAERDTAIHAVRMIRHGLDLKGVGGADYVNGLGVPVGSMIMACVESLHRSGDFSGPGCCYVPGVPEAVSVDDILNLPEEYDPGPRSANQIAAQVRAVDMHGRLSPPDLADLWRELQSAHPLGYTRAYLVISVASMPNLPRPVPTYASALDSVKPLIIGEFHDPATSYTGSQLMKDFFPNGALLSWQGYRHGLPSKATSASLDEPESSVGFMGGGHGAYECNSILNDYLETGTLPANGHTCPINGPAANALALDVAKSLAANGTCLSDMSLGFR